MVLSRLILNIGRNIFVSGHRRNISLSTTHRVKEIRETKEGNTLTIEGVYTKQPNEDKMLKRCDNGSCALCSTGLTNIKHTDVLIIKQFLRSDGTVLPKRISGLCYVQQRRIELMALMAHRSGLLPNMVPERGPYIFQKKEYKDFNTYYDDGTILHKYWS